jgi:hypothetical protein
MAEAHFRAFPGLSEHRAPLGRLDLSAAMAINIRPLWGQSPLLHRRWGKAPMGVKTLWG